MTNEFSRFQEELRRALCVSCGERFFLRRANEDDALWVCDLPRRRVSPEAMARAKSALTALDVRCELSGSPPLWRLDWQPERYERLSLLLPDTPPPFPQDASLHDAYALCRLLLLHPAPVAEQPLPLIRSALKLCSSAQGAAFAAVPQWHEQCAALLRQKRPLPALMGQIVGAWLIAPLNNS